MKTIILIVDIVGYEGWKMNQLDINSSFLNGPLDEDVYVRSSPRFEVKKENHKFYKLKKALYSLKWNRKIDSFFL